MSTAQTTSERDPGRWMALYSVIVAVLASEYANSIRFFHNFITNTEEI